MKDYTKYLLGYGSKGIDGIENGISDEEKLRIAEETLKNVHPILVTPEIAKELLKRMSPKQRNLSMSVVNEYTRMMLNGEWRSDLIDTMTIDTEGYIGNCQHRLHAIIKSNTTQVVYIQSNTNDELFEALDNGKSRTDADFFEGKNRATKATLMHTLLALDGNAPLKTAITGRILFDGEPARSSRKEVVAAINDAPKEEKEKIDQLISLNNRFRKTFGFGSTKDFVTAYHLIKEEYSDEDFMHYMNEVVGKDTKDTTIWQLQRALLQLSNRKMKKQEMSQIEIGWLILGAKKWLNNEPFKSFTNNNGKKQFEECEKRFNSNRDIRVEKRNRKRQK